MPPPTDGPPPVYELLAPQFYHMQPFLFLHLAGKAFSLRGFSTSVHNACSSGAFGIEIAAELIRSRQLDRAIVVGGESFDTGVRLEWFRRLGLYAERADAMRPFDAASSGFYVGEGAAAILLESEASAHRRTAPVLAEYVSGAFTHQAWKQTIPDVRSARLASVITSALSKAKTRISDVDLVVPHGAGTQLSDGYEAHCLAEAIADGGANVDVRSAASAVFKPYVGHMLAASGLIDTVCALLAMQRGQVPPLPHPPPTDSRWPLPFASGLLTRRLDSLLKLSTGFTGHDAALVFRKA